MGLINNVFTGLFRLNPMAFSDAETEQRFLEWIRPSQQSQMAAASALTGMLYLLYSLINYLTESSDILERMLSIHLLLVPPFPFIISYLGYRTRQFSLISFLLIIAPIVTNGASFYIHSAFTGITTYYTENYLCLFWIFIASGLSLYHALISAVLTLPVMLYGSLYFVDFTGRELTYHLFWLMCSVSFGVLGGYLIERASRNNFLAHLQLEKQAVSDSLTGLYNRNRLNEILLKELDRNRRFNHTFGVMLLDVDFFKKVNDTHGHSVGDQVLIAMANLFIQNARTTDYIFRWGGEEFIIICPETNEAGIMALAENLREKVAGYSFPVIDRSSISIGVTISRPDDSLEQIIERVDKALYQAKAQGRNRVIFTC